MAGGCERRGDAGSPRPEVGTEASGELSAAWGRLRRLAWVPYGVTCLAPLEGAVVMGLRDGLQVVALDGSPPAFAQGFRASCLAALGAPAGSFVAGTREGAALVFLWRRPGELTLRHQTLLPGGALRALAADGDICFSGSEDGAVQWMRVLEDRLEQHDFLQADSPVTCLAMGAERTSVLVGCQNGRVLEVDRQTAEVLLCVELGAPVVALAADPPEGCGPGGPRLLAAGGGRVAVWQEEADGGLWSIGGSIQGALLLPGGGAEDFVTARLEGLLRGPARSSAAPLALEDPDGGLPGSSLLAWHAAQGLALLVLGSLSEGRERELYELRLAESGAA